MGKPEKRVDFMTRSELRNLSPKEFEERWYSEHDSTQTGGRYIFSQAGSGFRFPSETIDRRKHSEYRASKCVTYIRHDLKAVL